MSKRIALIYAVIGLALVLWWGLTDSAIPLVAFIVLVVVAAVHVVIRTGGSDAATKKAIDEGHTRASFPSPPERPI